MFSAVVVALKIFGGGYVVAGRVCLVLGLIGLIGSVFLLGIYINVIMSYLVGSVVLNVLVFFFFKLMGLYQVNTFQAIVVNYVVCICTGLAFLGTIDPLMAIPMGESWFWMAGGLGGLFIGTFYLMAQTTQRAGVTVATVANKMSMVFSVFMGFILYEELRGLANGGYLMGLLAAVVSVFLISWKSEEASTRHHVWTFVLPFAVFLLGGILETLLGYGQKMLVPQGMEDVFTLYIFCSAAVVGISIASVRTIVGEPWQAKSIYMGAALGVPNFFSIYLLLMAIDAFEGNVAVIFPLANVGTILVSAVVSIFFFREKLSAVNWAGLGAALVAIALILIYSLNNGGEVSPI